MNQIIITDLDFCQGEFSNHDTLQGGGSFFKWDATFDGTHVSDPAGKAAAGFGVALALGIGGKHIVVRTGVKSTGGQT